MKPAPGVGAWVTNWIADYNTLPAEGSPSSELAFRDKLQMARQWADYYGRPVHIGEFGAYTMADTNSRARFYASFRAWADALGLGWAMWDWKAGFRYWDDAALKPAPGLREAMFPGFTLNSTAAGQFYFDSAVAKTFVIQRTTNPGAPNWSPIQTQTLVQPRLNFIDPGIGQNSTAFYRVFWVK